MSVFDAALLSESVVYFEVYFHIEEQSIVLDWIDPFDILGLLFLIRL